MTESEASYTPLAWNGFPEKDSWVKKYLKPQKISMKDTAITILAISTLALSIILLRGNADLRTSDIGYALENTSKRWTRYDWWSKYSSPAPKDEPAVEEIWDAILPAHGIVAVDHQWAAEKQLPASMSLPSDPQKGVYIIDAYHQIHCLKIIRKTFYQVARNEPLTYPLGHSMHCFDSLRQYIMCTAGETLLYSWGRNITGDGQFRKCKDWGALRDWATQNAACYRDSTTPIPLYNHFGYCDNGTDGFVLEA